jgi:hypothetical protein
MAERTCSIDGCENPVKGRGWCRVHYLRWYKTGNPLTIRPGRWEGYERPTCSVTDCDGPAHARGFCTIHFPRYRRHGDPLAGRRMNVTGTEEERFWAQTDRRSPDECWPWRFGRFATGYAQFTSDSGLTYGHRWVYERYVAPIPDGLVIDHRCHNEDQHCVGGRTCEHRRCVNPGHLEVVTAQQNFRRARLRSNEVN